MVSLCSKLSAVEIFKKMKRKDIHNNTHIHLDTIFTHAGSRSTHWAFSSKEKSASSFSETDRQKTWDAALPRGFLWAHLRPVQVLGIVEERNVIYAMKYSYIEVL